MGVVSIHQQILQQMVDEKVSVCVFRFGELVGTVV